MEDWGNSNMEIQTDQFNRAFAIAYFNKSSEPPMPYIWVCENKNAYDKALKKLQELSWIEIIAHGLSHVEPETI